MLTTAPLIEFSKLGKRFSFFWALKDASSLIYTNDIIGVIGMNGAGKSTLLYLLSKIYTPTTGQVTYYNKYVVYLMGRDTMLYSSFTGYENLKYFQSLYPHISEDSFKQCLEITGMYRFRHERVETYSYGMLKRFLITRMLLLKPDIIFLDEPFDGLDIEGQDLLQSIFLEGGSTEINWQYKAVIFVDHNLERCRKLANKIWRIEKGVFFNE